MLLDFRQPAPKHQPLHGWGPAVRQWDAEEVNGSYPYRVEMPAFTILFEKMAETLLVAIGHFLFHLVGREEAGVRSC